MRPLSCTRPKHLFPIGGRPLLDWTLQHLAECGIREVVFAVNYMQEAFVKRYGRSAQGMKLHYSRETKPLGTGGCIRKAKRLIGKDKNFLVLNGDILSNIDYARLIRQHAEDTGTGTIALYKVDNPSRYGVAEMTKENRIVRFVEKPELGKAPSNLINAGVYVLNSDIFDCIPAQERVSIEREVFPALASDKKLFGYKFDGLWIDMGESTDYLRGNRLLLDTEFGNGLIAKSCKLERTVVIRNPVVVGKNTQLGANTRIGPYAAICDNVKIGKKAYIENSIIFSDVVVSDFSSLKGALLGEGVFVGKRVKIEEDCIVGDHAVIHNNVTLSKGVNVCPHKEVTENAAPQKCLM